MKNNMINTLNIEAYQSKLAQLQIIYIMDTYFIKSLIWFKVKSFIKWFQLLTEIRLWAQSPILTSLLHTLIFE